MRTSWATNICKYYLSPSTSRKHPTYVSCCFSLITSIAKIKTFHLQDGVNFLWILPSNPFLYMKLPGQRSSCIQSPCCWIALPLVTTIDSTAAWAQGLSSSMPPAPPKVPLCGIGAPSVLASGTLKEAACPLSLGVCSTITSKAPSIKVLNTMSSCSCITF